MFLSMEKSLLVSLFENPVSIHSEARVSKVENIAKEVAISLIKLFIKFLLKLYCLSSNRIKYDVNDIVILHIWEILIFAQMP